MFADECIILHHANVKEVFVSAAAHENRGVAHTLARFEPQFWLVLVVMRLI